MYRTAICILLFSWALFLVSCNPGSESFDPYITIHEPLAGIELNIPDTVDVKVSVFNESILTSVYITIVDKNEAEIVQRKTFLPDQTQFYVETGFSLTDKNLETGTYYIKVVASDGSNTRNSLKAFLVNELPAELTGYIAVTSQIGITSTIYRMTPVFYADTQFVLNQPLLFSAVNGNWGNFFFISDEPSVLTAYQVSDFEPAWEVGAMPPRPEITAVISDDDLIFSTANGDVTILDRNGNIRIRTIAYDSKTITHLAADDLYIYASHVSLSGDIRELSVFYRVTGAIRDQKLLSGEIRDLVAFGGKVFIFMPSGNDIAIMGYDPETMILEQVNMIGNENLRAALNIADEEICLLTDSKVITYVPVYNDFHTFMSQPYEMCRYNYLDDDVFFVKGKELSRFDRVSGDFISLKTFQDEIMDFQVVYNK